MSLVSVIIPAYNAERFISETIDSVINQTYKYIEIIVIDDGSTDNTRNIVEKKMETDSRIVLKQILNNGVSNARNTGFNLSKGNFVSFLDADDLWLPNNIKYKWEYLVNSSENIGLVHSDMEIIDENSHSTGNILSGKSGNILNSILLWDGTNIPTPSSILVKREAIKQAGEFDINLSTAADQDFFLRIASKYEIGRIPFVLGKYRIHEHNMHNNISLMEKDHCYVFKKAKKSGLFKSFLFQRKCFSNLYLILAGSWWKDGHNKIKGTFFVFKAVLYYPLIINKLIKKVF